MTLFQQSILAIVQAILEWLPVSSEGFLVIVGENVFGINALEAFRIAIYFHLGTALAVLIRFRKTFRDALFKDRTLLRLLIVSAAGTAVTGIPLYLLLNLALDSGLSESSAMLGGMFVTLFVGIALIITATLLRYGRLR
jgi:undecaprenyl-diphosphatase